MFSQILWQSEFFRTKLASESFLFAMDIVVPLERKLGSEFFTTVWELAFKLGDFLHIVMLNSLKLFVL
jgi:hypothetical protein